MKQAYRKPKLIVHGDLEVITQQGGGGFIDVPQGTPVDSDADIGDVTGS